MDAQEIGQKVAKRRKELGISQEEFAKKVGISRNYLSIIERGEANNISINILQKIALGLYLSPSEFTGPTKEREVYVSSSLRDFALEEGLNFETVDRLSRLPRRGQEPKTKEGWKRLYEVIKEYL